MEGILFLEVKNLFSYRVEEENSFYGEFIFNGFFFSNYLYINILYILIGPNDINFATIIVGINWILL